MFLKKKFGMSPNTTWLVLKRKEYLDSIDTMMPSMKEDISKWFLWKKDSSCYELLRNSIFLLILSKSGGINYPILVYFIVPFLFLPYIQPQNSTTDTIMFVQWTPLLFLSPRVLGGNCCSGTRNKRCQFGVSRFFLQTSATSKRAINRIHNYFILNRKVFPLILLFEGLRDFGISPWVGEKK